ncbi:MAG: SDR family oxidoreductase [Rhodobacteraceae bacterium]|nr:SDR family oxidoreductase [Paracoccaceae bacterium]MCB1401347.1 SDR family oxidoreductase [Paracoccaceae bacterium]MCC0066915.1 SDR family oxidoreductase [Rhodovulum sp.]
MDLGIAGSRALIIGASGGLGAACAARLAEAGCDLHLVARRKGPLMEVARALSDRYRVACGTTAADQADPEARLAILRDCPDPDMLVISGGWPDRVADPASTTLAEWRRSVEAMMLPAIDLVTRIYPGMVERGFGRIVVVTSRLIKDPEPDLAMPAAARLGLTGFLKALSREVAPHGVTVNTLLPGVFGTGTQMASIAAASREAGHGEAEEIARRMRATPAGRLGRPEEFSSLCAYLCSAQAGFLTGQALVMDGGAHTGIW